MKKRIVFLLLLAVAAGIAAASVPDKKIVVRNRQGSAEYAVADIMSLKFGNGDVYMNMNDGSVVNWAAGGIDMMSFLYYEPSPETGIGENCVQSFSIFGRFHCHNKQCSGKGHIDYHRRTFPVCRLL